MENIASHLKLGESKQRNLCKAHEQLHSEASSFLLLSLQWKDLEEHFDSAGELIRRQYKELEERERGVSLKENQLRDVESSIHEYSREVDLKKNELRKLTGLIAEYNVQVMLKEKELESAQERLSNFSSDLNIVCTRITHVKEELEEKEKEVEIMHKRNINVEKELEEKERTLNVVKKRIEDCEREIGLKERKLNGIMKLIEERSRERDLNEKHVESIRALLVEHEEELATKEKHYDAIQMEIKESSMELKLKENELETIQNMLTTKRKEMRLECIEKNIKLRIEELDIKEKEIGSMQSKLQDLSEQLEVKESELEAVKRCIEEHSKELDLQEKELGSTQKSTQDCQNRLILIAEYVSLIEKAIIECSKELGLDENHLELVQDSFDDCSYELQSVDKQDQFMYATVHKCLQGLKAKEKQFNLLKKSVEERIQKLTNEEGDFARLMRELTKKEEELTKKEEGLTKKEEGLTKKEEELNKKEGELNKNEEKSNLMQKNCRKCLKEFQIVEKDIGFQQKSLEESLRNQSLKERQYGVQTEKFKSMGKDIDPTRDSMEKDKDKEKLIENQDTLHLKIKPEESDCRPAQCSNGLLNFHSGMTVDGKFLLFLLCEHLKVHDFVRSEVAITLQTSPDSAKFVLDAMRWFYPTPMMTEDTKFDVHNIKRGCILLAELMFKISPQIAPSLKEEALELAVHWKDKLTALNENHLDIVAFLLLLANFRLASAFDADELRTLWNSISHYKQAVDLRRTLGIADILPVGNTISGQPQPSPTNEPSISSFKNVQLSLKPDERRLQLLLNRQSTRHDLIPSAILAILQKSTDPAKLVLDVIQGSFDQQLKKEGIGFEARSLVWFKLLFEQLMEISPHICPMVRENAARLAVDWKSKIRIDNNSSMEAVAFLRLLVSYGLTSSFREDEIFKLFENSEEREQVAELWAMFGFTRKLHDLVRNIAGMKQFSNAVKFINKYKLNTFQPVQILNRYLQKETSHEKYQALGKEMDNLCFETSSQSLENLLMSLDARMTNEESSEPSFGPQNLDSVNNNNSQQPLQTSFGSQQPFPSRIESQQPLPVKIKTQQPLPVKIETQQQHSSEIESQPLLSKIESQQPLPSKPLPSKIESQQHPSKMESQHPHPSKVESQHPHPHPSKIESQHPHPHPSKIESQHPHPHPSKIEAHQPHPSKNKEQQPHPSKNKEQQPHPSKNKAHSPHPSKFKAAHSPHPSKFKAAHSPHPSKFKAAHQPHPSKIDAYQPHPLRNAQQANPPKAKAQHPYPKKRKSKPPQHHQVKYPRTSSPNRSNDFSNPNLFGQGNPRYINVHGPFSFHEYGFASTQHDGSHPPNSRWPRP